MVLVSNDKFVVGLSKPQTRYLHSIYSILNASQTLYADNALFVFCVRVGAISRANIDQKDQILRMTITNVLRLVMQ